MKLLKNSGSRPPSPRPARRMLGAMVLMAGAATSAASADINVTRADTFRPGIFWNGFDAYFTYRWTITATGEKGMFNDYEVWHTTPNWLANLNLTSHAGSGAIAGPQPVGGIRVQTGIPGFPNPVTGSIRSTINPPFAAGRLNFQITRDGQPINAAVTVALQPVPGNGSTVAGSTLVAYSPGTFAPNIPIDLFQTTSLPGFDAHIGFATTDAMGAATIPLNRPLDDPRTNELLIGLDGQLVYSVEGLAPCYANCDGSTGTPALTGNDFTCFINGYANNESYANCDGSTGTPALTGNDFTCFINAFAAGCS